MNKKGNCSQTLNSRQCGGSGARFLVWRWAHTPTWWLCTSLPSGDFHAATAVRGAHEHSGRMWIENTGELGGQRGYDLCGRASERRELLTEKVPQLLNDPFESSSSINRRTQSSDSVMNKNTKHKILVSKQKIKQFLPEQIFFKVWQLNEG